MGQMKSGRGNDILVAYGVGSCVIAVCYDSTRPLAVMLHAVLPEKPEKRAEISKYVDTGIEASIKSLLDEKTNIKDIKAKVFGGARMFDIKTEGNTIGGRNAEKAREVLELKGIRIEAEDTGRDYGRTIEYFVADNRAEVKSFKKGTVIF